MPVCGSVGGGGPHLYGSRVGYHENIFGNQFGARDAERESLM